MAEGQASSRTDAGPGAPPTGTRALLRGLAVLETLSESSHGLGPTEIASLLELDKGTVFRMLGTLVEAGYVRRDPASRTYALSMKILHLSQGLSQHLDLRGAAHPHLVRLCEQVNETVHLGVRDDAQVVYVDKVEPTSQTIRMVSAVGQAMPLHTTALGKAMMSGYPRELLHETLAGISFAPVTSRAITDRETLERELEQTRERGYAVDDQENQDNVTCVGAPLVAARGEVVAAISISSPSFRVDGRLAGLGSLCRAVAEAISREL